MPRKKGSQIQTTLSQATQDDTISSVWEDTNIVSAGRNLSELDLDFLEMEIEQKYSVIKERELTCKYELSNLKLNFNTLLCSIPESILNMPIEMKDEFLGNIFINSGNENQEPTVSKQIKKAPATVRKGRSRSARGSEIIEYGPQKLEGRSRRKRSVSLDMFKTPVNRVCVTDLTSAKKYTVSKTLAKAEDSGISYKRVMKPDEEAISTRGSPLFVHPTTTIATAPTVHIPLPGGLVINVEPKTPKRDCVVPELDDKTKMQLKLICDQLTNLFEI